MSVYLPDATRGSTSSVHEEGWRTGFVSRAGDFSGSVEFPIGAELRSDFYLSAIDVLAPAQASAIVAFGDSITDGTGSTLGADRKWPDDLARRLRQEQPDQYSVVNMAIGGNRLLKRSIGPSGLARTQRDILEIPGARVVVVLEGINDIAGDEGTTRAGVSAAQLIEGLPSLSGRAHGRGLRVVGATITPTRGCPDCGGRGGW